MFFFTFFFVNICEHIFFPLIAWKLRSWTKTRENANAGWQAGAAEKKANAEIKLLGNNRLIILPFILLLCDFHFQMRYTKKVSMWPVGLITKYGVSSPIVRNGTISGFYDGWIGGRKFPVDMAGFAVNVNFLLSRPNASMPYKPGYEEDGFLKSLSPLNLTEIELMATNCTQVWKGVRNCRFAIVRANQLRLGSDVDGCCS